MNTYYVRTEYGRNRFIEKRITNELVELDIEISEGFSEGKKLEDDSSNHEQNPLIIAEVAVKNGFVVGERSKIVFPAKVLD